MLHFNFNFKMLFMNPIIMYNDEHAFNKKFALNVKGEKMYKNLFNFNYKQRLDMQQRRTA